MFYKLRPKMKQFLNEIKSCENFLDYQKVSLKFNAEKFELFDMLTLSQALHNIAIKIDEKIFDEMQEEAKRSDDARLDLARNFGIRRLRQN